jgi:hypothetical protein
MSISDFCGTSKSALGNGLANYITPSNELMLKKVLQGKAAKGKKLSFAE